MNKFIRYSVYVLIIAICIAAILIGVYGQFFMEEDNGDEYGYYANENGNLITEDDIKQSFLDLFTNEFYSNYDDSDIIKIDETKELVYTAYSQTAIEEDKYNISFNIPMINIDTGTAMEYNSTTQSVFVDKINAVMTEVEEYTIYNLDYIAYTNNEILSVAIMATIKEGDSSQRIIIQTYNYNLDTGENVTLSDILEYREIDETVVQNKISTAIKKAADDANAKAEAGYSVYQRNEEDEMYNIENVMNFIQGPNGELYIIFAYGNNNYTSEMDIVEI